MRLGLGLGLGRFFKGRIMQATVLKLVDQSVSNSQTLVDDADLQFAIGVNETWVIEAHLHVTAASAGGIAFTFTAPAGATGAMTAILSGDQAVTLAGSAALGSTIAATLSSTIHAHDVSAYVVNSTTAGAVKMRWAQFASNGTATIVKAGSYLVAFRIS